MPKPNPGQDFEDAFRASIPKGVYVRRLRTPTAMGFVVPRLVALVGELSGILHRPVPDWVSKSARFRFTAKAGFDLLLTVPAGESELHSVCPVIVFALELKSVDGASLPFANVDGDQEKALAECELAGHIAALVIEFRKAGEVWAIPFQAWREVRLVSQRASLPIADARRIGTRILPDVGRGKSRQYWDVASWLQGCCAPKAEPRDLFAMLSKKA